MVTSIIIYCKSTKNCDKIELIYTLFFISICFLYICRQKNDKYAFFTRTKSFSCQKIEYTID